MGSPTPRKKLRKMSEDRLSGLPKTAIETILRSLPLRDAARTSVLSQEWRYEWANLPYLVFKNEHISVLTQLTSAYSSKLVKIVDQVLLQHRGPIHRFELYIFLEDCMDMDRWINFVSRNGIREMIINTMGNRAYTIPHCLFSCGDMIHLELAFCTLIPPPSFKGFRNLRTLRLKGVMSSKEGLENLISNCPLLNRVDLNLIFGCTHLKISAPNLAVLNLATALNYLCFEKTPLLVEASIYLFSDEKFGKVNLVGRLPSIRKLELCGNTYQALSFAGDVCGDLSFTSRLLHLSVCINFSHLQEVLYALGMFKRSSLLQKVDITCKTRMITPRARDDFWQAQVGLDCCFGKLQRINVTEFAGTAAELNFIESVLANAPVLETVNIGFKVNLVDVVTILMILNGFRRRSSKTKVLFSGENFSKLSF